MTTLPHRAAALAAATALSLAGCGGDATGGGGAPASIGVVTAPAAVGTAGMALTTAPTFVVRDARGSALGGVPVTVEVVAGGGTLASAPARSRQGATPVGSWTLGTVAGENRLRIAVAGVKPETLTVTGAAGAPAAIVVAQGNDQSALGGRAVATAVRFVLRDQFGNGVAGHTLSLQPTNGGTLAGTCSVACAATATTGADGGVDAPAWTLARRVVPQTLVATLAGGSLFASAAAAVRTSFDIDVRVVGTMTPAQQALFTDAAARLRAVIVGDLPNVPTGSANLATLCADPALPTIDETIDDVLIFAQVKAIDGAGGILGRAGPCLIRGEGGRLPVVGVMEFDEADISRMLTTGTATDVMLHEMMHVLGFSAGYFDFFGLISGIDTRDVAFTGANGLRGCRDAGGATLCAATVPLENAGGAGTVNSHWREATFDTELMTGFINGAARPISLMTVGAFQDLGYEVNDAAKDPYALPAVLARAGGPIPSLAVGGGEAWEIVLPPRVMISRDGPRRRLLTLP